MTGTITLVLGRLPGPASVLRPLRTHLHRAGAEVTLTVVPPDGALPAAARTADLRVLKDLSPVQLRAAAAHSAARWVDDPEAVLRCRDKAVTAGALRAAGVPSPATTATGDWAEVRRLAAQGPVVVKPRTGTGGHGVELLDGPAPSAPHTPGPWVVQDRVPTDGTDLKLYVVGARVLGVRRRWPAPEDRSGTAFPVPADLAATARAAAAALDLGICGVDLVESPQGPVVVDVNPFPGFKGTPGAAEALAAHLLACLRQPEVAGCA